MANNQKNQRNGWGRNAEAGRKGGLTGGGNRGNSLRGFAAMYDDDDEEPAFGLKSGRAPHPRGRNAATDDWDEDREGRRKSSRVSGGR
jgi:hypothetical protein